MRIKILTLAIAGALAACGSVVKTPANCTSRPCQYVLTCAATTCTSTENAELQAALNDAWRGDTIVLTAGKIWSGNFTVSARPGTAGYLTITSSAAANLPPAGVRISPSHSGNMPRLRMINATSVLTFPASATPASYIRLSGIEFDSLPSVNGSVSSSADLIRIGTGGPSSPAMYPNNIEFAHCYIHGDYAGEIRNGILGNGNHITVRDSYISEIKMSGIETHAFVTYDAMGPFTIHNNYLEATSIPVLIGGGAQSIPEALPSDLDFRYNFFHKPAKWFSIHPDYVGTAYTNKNMLEYKIGDRSTVRWNVFDQNFKGPNNDQSGQAIAFNIRMPNGTASFAYARTQDILFANNVIRKSLGTYSILGSDSNYSFAGLVKRITIRDNLFQEIGCVWDYQNCASYKASFGRLIAGGEDFVIENNTIHTTDSQVSFATGYGMLFDGTSSPSIHNLTFRNNISPSGSFGWKGDGLGIGSATINAKTNGTVIITKNVMPGMSSAWNNCLSSGADTRTCSGNYFPTTAQWDANYVKWIDPPRDFQLRGQPQPSPYWKASSTNGPLGADVSQLPLIRNMRAIPGSQAAVLAWDLTTPIAGFPCVLEVSTNRNLVSRLNSWAPIPDVNPVLVPQADLSTREGNVNEGAARTFVLGTDAIADGQDRRLTPATTYYYRLMCAGDSAQGSFQTTAAPASSTRDLQFSATPPQGKGIAKVDVSYGEKETGAPDTLTGSLLAVPCSSSCLVSIPGVSHRAQYVRLTYRNNANAVVATVPVRVFP